VNNSEKNDLVVRTSEEVVTNIFQVSTKVLDIIQSTPG
jgi:hypothetical protein